MAIKQYNYFAVVCDDCGKEIQIPRNFIIMYRDRPMHKTYMQFLEIQGWSSREISYLTYNHYCEYCTWQNQIKESQ